MLPARLKEELELLEEYILEGRDIASTKIENMLPGQQEFLPKYKDINKDNIHEILQKEWGIVFTPCSRRCRCIQMHTGRQKWHLCDSLKEHYNNKCSGTSAVTGY